MTAESIRHCLSFDSHLDNNGRSGYFYVIISSIQDLARDRLRTTIDRNHCCESDFVELLWPSYVKRGLYVKCSMECNSVWTGSYSSER